MKSLFETEAKSEIEERLSNLTPVSQPQWGKMDVSQMLHHCQLPLEIVTTEKHDHLKPNFLAKLLFKKSLYSDKPWRKNLPTIPSFRITSSKNFDKEKNALKELINSFYLLKDKNAIKPHPILGDFTKEQWGKMQYKHLDHHFNQFGV